MLQLQGAFEPIKVDESSLTGESLPATKSQGSKVQPAQSCILGLKTRCPCVTQGPLPCLSAWEILSSLRISCIPWQTLVRSLSLLQSRVLAWSWNEHTSCMSQLRCCICCGLSQRVGVHPRLCLARAPGSYHSSKPQHLQCQDGCPMIAALVQRGSTREAFLRSGSPCAHRCWREQWWRRGNQRQSSQRQVAAHSLARLWRCSASLRRLATCARCDPSSL